MSFTTTERTGLWPSQAPEVQVLVCAASLLTQCRPSLLNDGTTSLDQIPVTRGGFGNILKLSNELVKGPGPEDYSDTRGRDPIPRGDPDMVSRVSRSPHQGQKSELERNFGRSFLPVVAGPETFGRPPGTPPVRGVAAQDAPRHHPCYLSAVGCTDTTRP
jgi:hypothetical protein